MILENMQYSKLPPIFALSLTIVLLVCIPFQIVAQGGQTSISIHYVPAYSKTHFTESIGDYLSRNTVLVFNQLYNVQVPDKGKSGYDLGIEINRRIAGNYFIGLVAGFSVKGQKSRLIFAFDNRDPSQYPTDYGGTAYDLKYETAKLGFSFGKHLQSPNRMKLTVNGRIGVDIFHKLKLQNYLLSKSTGIISEGCCTSTFAFNENMFFYRISKGYFSLFMSLGLDTHIALGKWLRFSLGPQIGVSSPVFKKDISFPVVFHGVSTWFGCSLALTSSF